MSNPTNTMAEMVAEQAATTATKQCLPQPQSESASALQSLDESAIVFLPPALSPSQTTGAPGDDDSAAVGANDATEVETLVQEAPFQPDDLVSLADITKVDTNIETSTTDQLKLVVDQDTVPLQLEQMPSSIDPPLDTNSLPTASPTPATTTVASDTTPGINQADAMPTPQQTPLQQSAQPPGLPARPAILRASMSKRTFSRMDASNPATDGDDEIVSSDIKRQRGNQPGSVTSTTTTTTTTTSASTTTTTTNNSGLMSSNKILIQQFKELTKNPPTGITVDIDQGNLHRWKVVMLGPPGTPYEGGIFPCTMQFPSDYPQTPPIFSFTPNFPHPNVFSDGKVCISILHDPNDNNYQHEPQSERWKPILGVEAILLSVMSLLSEPNTNSPANVEMSKLFRDNQREYRKRIILAVRKSQEDFMMMGNGQ